jgi:hypothetical protein
MWPFSSMSPPVFPGAGREAALMRHLARVFATAPLLLALCAPSSAEAAEVAPRYRWLGLQADVGVPDGAGIGVAVRPGITWARLEASYTYSVVASGVRGGVTLDPFDAIIAPTITVEGGETFNGELPGSWVGLSNNPRLNYEYVNVHLGLELGRRDSWRIFIRGGATRVHAEAADLRAANGTTTTTVDRLEANANVLGTAKIGFMVLF